MFTLASYFHDLNPVLFDFGNGFAIRWYGLSYLAGFTLAYFALRQMARRDLILIPERFVADAMLWLVAGTIVGGRMGYVLFYDDHLRMLREFSSTFPFWGVFAIQKGGMASHGGMVGLALACWRISRGFKDERGEVVGRCSVWHIMDAVALVAPAGIFFGRIANFINGELLGKIASPPGTQGPWWSVQYTQELEWWVRDQFTEQPVPGPRLEQTSAQWNQLLELARKAAPKAPLEDALDVLVHRSHQFADQLRPLISSRHPSQLYQAAAEGLVLGSFLWLVWIKPRKPGIIAAWFLIMYGVLRVLTELVRLPDAHLAHERFAGLSRGQWLSVLMVAIGSWMLWHTSRAASSRLGGWGTGAVRPVARI